jgi:hypothetical protein
MYAMATKRRADAAQKLGRHDEALETYELAVTRLRAQELELVGFALPRAMIAYAELLNEQDRTKEAFLLIGRACVATVKLALPKALRRQTASKRSTGIEPS